MSGDAPSVDASVEAPSGGGLFSGGGISLGSVLGGTAVCEPQVQAEIKVRF